MKAMSSKAVVLRFNLVFIALFLIFYTGLLLTPSIDPQGRQMMVRSCPSDGCQMTKVIGNNTRVKQSKYEGNRKLEAYSNEGEGMMVKVKPAINISAVRKSNVPREERVAKENRGASIAPVREVVKVKQRILGVAPGKGLVDVKPGTKIALVNLKDTEVQQWKNAGEATVIGFDKVSELFRWDHLFPEWIDEEEVNKEPSCPEIPMPDFGSYGRDFELVVVRLPCKFPEKGWKRDVHRLQVHLITANLGVRNGKEGLSKLRFLFLGSCMPMVEMFRCEELVRREGDAWLYDSDLLRLEEKVSLPIGSCKLSLPLWKEGTNEIADLWKRGTAWANEGRTRWRHQWRPPQHPRREAYVTVLHSSELYACGAITLAQTLLQTNTTRDLVILVDRSISPQTRLSLQSAGWKVREITRIRNPFAKKNSYNEYNYSKLRLWQLTRYDRVVFIDSDILVLRNLDVLFDFPQLSATGNDGVIFNSGVMVIEPSKCMFKNLMRETKRVVSYNGGDQGFLNEVFIWWHRLPRRVNYLKNKWSTSTMEGKIKDQLFGSDPPKLYGVHYLGMKPWLCYRDYDCNWDMKGQEIFASDVAHRRWWMVHDKMAPDLQKLCLLTPRRKFELQWDRKLAKKARFGDGHWRINITDPRQSL
ncbi:UDP-glucuronate:xylan alpha-glucuronosyltransferase 2 isoform X1 [Nymphaea colorata]|nr:UDP-glucuronate:xylan alpha-glucuronosyltransferase 2 isoform X1 [Nymphaea colorata]